MSDRDLHIAAECLRQMWQTLDAGGTSMGRSREAMWLETAMLLIPYQNQYSSLADKEPSSFEELRLEAKHMALQRLVAARDKELGLDPLGGWQHEG